MSPAYRGLYALVGSIPLMLVLGSVHAFSVFLQAIEEELVASISNVSLTYSLALGALTASVLLGHHVFRVLPASSLALVVCLVGAAGCALAGISNKLVFVWIGYGLIFGAANGLGYAFALQFSAQANPETRGMAMGLVTASYGIGAFLAPVPLDRLIDAFGFQGGMLGLSTALVIIAPFAAIAYARSGTQIDAVVVSSGAWQGPSFGSIATIWIAYGSAVAAGLMVMGHATSIARSADMQDDWVVAAPSIVALFNVAGSILGGYFIKSVGPSRLIGSVVAVSGISALVMSYQLTTTTVLVGLSIIGFAYGASIAAIPAAISLVFGPVEGIWVYGRVFTAWGAAGLFSPWMAGYLFERQGDYSSALILASFLSCISVLALTRFPESNPS